ncbi:MAG: gas vesicle protein [Jatrophihabitans sp.]|jgi:hypothetical protein|nr:gas vesicle protein [Jatrophihabitans sp.]MDT4900874.1 hypothetical protein [Pseudonocardiales bacterium]MCW2658477.1 gas vesicle protein [Jatrophihabitans sp.]MDT4905147.1 hypothetical protein [Pseudonocardiales bacterium]MDT4930599.1 hypothetical protein [Pseudonocardiales bacterium]
MGLFTALLTLPLAPLRGVVTVAEVLEREAYRQWTDPATVRAQLADVEAAFEAGELTEAERDALQDELVARLLASRAGDNR